MHGVEFASAMTLGQGMELKHLPLHEILGRMHDLYYSLTFSFLLESWTVKSSMYGGL